MPQFCLNQCSHRGRCEQGFCICRPGWWGIDCSLPSATRRARLGRARQTASAGSFYASFEQKGLAPVHTNTSAAAGEVGGETHVTRPLIYVYEMPSSFTTEWLQVEEGGRGGLKVAPCSRISTSAPISSRPLSGAIYKSSSHLAFYTLPRQMVTHLRVSLHALLRHSSPLLHCFPLTTLRHPSSYTT